MANKARNNVSLLIIGAAVIVLPFFLAKRAPHSASVSSNVDKKVVVATENEAPALSAAAHNEIKPEDQKKLQVLQEILSSKNDNDPRVDSELKNLSPALHHSAIELYQKLPAENRNGRGFLVFLISRDLQYPEDYQFLQSIYEESPCLSLENCGQTQNADPHLSGVTNISLVYPQMVALYQIEKKLNQKMDLTSSSDQLRSIVIQAENFAAPSVQKKATEISQRL
jgi:hypothetical protein